MIYLGQNSSEKKDIITHYCSRNNIEKVVFVSPEKFFFELDDTTIEVVEYKQVIQYKFFYRLLKEINNNTLIVINECIRTSNRNDLTYNCIRHYLNQTKHQLIFQYFPFINSFDDFMILFDFDTNSQWKREQFSRELLKECSVHVKKHSIIVNPVRVNASSVLKEKYEKEKQQLFSEIGLKDPHTIPRNLHLLGGKEKLLKVESSKKYIARNNRFKLDNISTYSDLLEPNQAYILFEHCHNFIDFNDVCCLTNQLEFSLITTDLKVDEWYLERLNNWIKMLEDGYTAIQ